MNAKETARQLIKDNFPIAKYEAIQAERERRLKFWKEKEIDILIFKEVQLIKFGKKVLRIMWEHAIMNALKNHKTTE